MKMPIYDFKCPAGHIDRNVVARHDDTVTCTGCGQVTERYWGETRLMFDRVFGAHDMAGYHCPVTDEFVTSRKRRKQIMKEHGLEEVGGSDRKTIAQRRKENGGKAPPSKRPASLINKDERMRDITRTVEEMWR